MPDPIANPLPTAAATVVSPSAAPSELPLAPSFSSPATPEPAPQFSNIEQTDPILAGLPLATTPETHGGPFGRVQCGKCSAEFLTSRPNLKCPKCGGTPTGASLERAFGRGDEHGAVGVGLGPLK